MSRNILIALGSAAATLLLVGLVLLVLIDQRGAEVGIPYVKIVIGVEPTPQPSPTRRPTRIRRTPTRMPSTTNTVAAQLASPTPTTPPCPGNEQWLCDYVGVEKLKDAKVRDTVLDLARAYQRMGEEEANKVAIKYDAYYSIPGLKDPLGDLPKTTATPTRSISPALAPISPTAASETIYKYKNRQISCIVFFSATEEFLVITYAFTSGANDGKTVRDFAIVDLPGVEKVGTTFQLSGRIPLCKK